MNWEQRSCRGRPVCLPFLCVYTDDEMEGIYIKIDLHIDGEKGRPHRVVPTIEIVTWSVLNLFIDFDGG